MACPERLIQIALGRSSPLQGALRASKTLARFFEQEFSSGSGHPKNKKAPEGTFWFLARPERFELPTARFVAEYSIQLSYGRVVHFRGLGPLVQFARRARSYNRKFGGERGIRTLEGVLALTPLAGERFRPLSHLSEFRD